jgi:hypothetical protein
VEFHEKVVYPHKEYTAGMQANGRIKRTAPANRGIQRQAEKKKAKQQEIAKEYYNKIDKNQNLTLENYLQKETARNQQIGIFQINMEIFELREKLGEIIDKIINDLPIEINLN